MFRLTFFLCGTIFLTMLIGGQDRGQLRFGLMPQPEPVAVAVAPQPEPETVAPEAAVTEAAFIPQTPVMVQPAVEVVTATPEPAAQPVAEAAPVRVMRVDTRSANVRQGPGTDQPVVGRLTRGEEVIVVTEGQGPDGWSLIRIEGDGLEGWVAARLLTE